MSEIIGILGIQGSFKEHEKILQTLNKKTLIATYPIIPIIKLRRTTTPPISATFLSSLLWISLPVKPAFLAFFIQKGVTNQVRTKTVTNSGIN